MSIHFRLHGYFLRDTLIILDSTAEVDTSHGLNEDGKCSSFSDSRNAYGLLVLHTVDLTNVLSVDKHLGIVVAIGQRKHTRFWYLGEKC